MPNIGPNAPPQSKGNSRSQGAAAAARVERRARCLTYSAGVAAVAQGEGARRVAVRVSDREQKGAGAAGDV